MAKRKKKQTKKSIPRPTLTSIEKTRTGGAVSLTGFDYQCLYSCYTVLKHLVSETESVSFEGVEDIDSYVFDDTNQVKHIQVKYSGQKQNASFLKSILKNYLEVYLCTPSNPKRQFVLVYDFIISDGYFKRFVENNCNNEKKMDVKEVAYWTKVIDKIKDETPHWNWEFFSLNDFMSKIKFEYTEYQTLFDNISNLLVDKYSITTGNELLYAHSLYFYCFSKMKSRGKSNKRELDSYILEVSEAISMGAKNPAVHWIKPISFDNISPAPDNMYFEGKKATPADIVAGLPVPRTHLENTIKESIKENKVTVIKASSGQGKTTLAWRIAYNERDYYSVYQIVWCMESKELDYIVEYIRSRIKVGEIPLIIFDNLDAQLREWNQLAQLLETNLGSNYRLLITTRESDWYIYSGDQSNIRNLKVHNIILDGNQAQGIFQVFSTNGKIHPNITNWQGAWEKIGKQGLLIEYVYLLTHGEMLSERLAAQMKGIEQQTDRDLKFDVLRKICFADVLGIGLASDKFCTYYEQKKGKDITSIIKSFENEYLMTVNNGAIYISGLHPVRSQHLLNIVQQFSSKANTILDLLDIIDTIFVSKLYANIPLFTIETDKEDFYNRLISKTSNKPYQYYLDALRGVYSGSVYNYYQKNKDTFDDVNNHGGLEIFLMDINPYSRFDKFDTEVQGIAEMHQILPDDENIAYLKSVVDSAERFNIKESDYYLYAYYLYSNVLKIHTIKTNIEGFPSLAYWLLNVDSRFNIISAEIIRHFWDTRNTVSVQALSELMLSWYIGDESEYSNYVLDNKEDILSYLKIATKSISISEKNDDHSIHVKYLLLPSEIQTGNTESVERLNLICKFLPIYDYYCADSIRPQADFLDNFKTPDDSHKKMPQRNLIIMFHKEYANLWSDTILSNYEASTVFEWLDFWATTRQMIIELCKKAVSIMEQRLNQKKVAQATYSKFDTLRDEMILRLRGVYPYPRQYRLFEESKVPQEAKLFTNKYFTRIRTYFQQLVGLLLREEKDSRLAIINLRNAKYELNEMQAHFQSIAEKSGYYLETYVKLAEAELKIIEKLLIYSQYYLKHSNSRIATPVNINNWSKMKNQELLNQVESHIENNNLYSMNFEYPSKRLDDGTLYTLPLISENVDLTDETVSTGLIFALLPLASIEEIDFVILIFKTDQEAYISPSGIRINKDFLANVKKVIEENDDSHLENSFKPYPIEITDEMIQDFDTKYSIASVESIGQYDILFEKVWKYAQLKKYIEKSKYLAEMENSTRKEINIAFESLSTITHLALREYAESIMRKVLDDGGDFDDKDFNDAYNMILNGANKE